MNKSYLLLGSNIGDREQMLLQAKKNIQKLAGRMIRQSKLYQTKAWGNTNQPDFLNQAIIIETKLTAEQLMQTILSIEKNMHRIRTFKNAPRIIDIDILFFNHQIIEQKDLTIPHPEIPNRRFVLIPLNELSPNLKHPVLKKNIHHLLHVCKDKLDVKKF